MGRVPVSLARTPTRITAVPVVRHSEGAAACEGLGGRRPGPGNQGLRRWAGHGKGGPLPGPPAGEGGLLPGEGGQRLGEGGRPQGEEAAAAGRHGESGRRPGEGGRLREGGRRRKAEGGRLGGARDGCPAAALMPLRM